MGHALLAYNAAAAAAGASNVDLLAAVDSDFSTRSGHYIFTEQYTMLGAALVGVSVNAGRFQVPTWNAIGQFEIDSLNRTLQPPANPQVDWWLPSMPMVPLNEEFQVQASNNLGAATEQETAAIWLATTEWNANLPRGRMTLLVRASFISTNVLNAWSGPTPISLIQSLRGGVYAVVGASVTGTNASLFRIIFPRYRLYHGRKLRPGGFVVVAQGTTLNNSLDPYQLAFGEWGRFHTFELPQAETFGIAAGAQTYNLKLWLVYLGEDISQLNQGLGGGY